MTTATSLAALIKTHFGELKDPRAAHSIEHKLIDILIITICATICGANDYQVPRIDILESLLGATACYLCQTRTHPEIEQLIELSDKMMIDSAIQQGVETPAE